MANKQTIDDQTRMYLYDLMNTAKEHGFRADDSWELLIGSDIEKLRIQKDYHPAIVTRMVPEELLQVYHSVKSHLKQELKKEDQSIGPREIANGELKYLVAYNLKRPRN
jgi:hypothetical protein